MTWASASFPLLLSRDNNTEPGHWPTAALDEKQ